MERLTSYLEGRWQAGDGPLAVLVNPATEEPLCEVAGGGLDLGKALAHARRHGGPALGALTFRERGRVLAGLAEALRARRDALLDIEMRNNGATRSDAKFDVDGAALTLTAYAELGDSLGDRRWITDGEAVELARSKRLGGIHVKRARPGVAVHINAFNFPAWGLAEKLAPAILAGMPVVSKPATATALTAWAMARAFVESGALPEGSFGFLAGPAGDLVDHLSYGDVMAFTGSSELGCRLKGLPHVVRAGVAVNLEADSLNAAVLGPDVEPGSETWDLFVRDVLRDLTQKTGQKCTAIRRVLCPAARLDELTEALVQGAAAVGIGDPMAEGVRMGPVVNARQRDDVMAGLQRLGAALSRVRGEGRPREVLGVGEGRGYFVDVHLFRSTDPAAAIAPGVVHELEVFGPAASILAYDGTPEAASEAVALGRGSLVSSVYSDDRGWTERAVWGLCAWNGRVTLGSKQVAEASPGPGTVLPELVHGGPGRAGGGEELGLWRGMDLYLQRTAIQGYRPLVERLAAGLAQ
jgi:oxepin-CoA hydrolase/3-oxo-5,6-dehydrosuberyl-CoA semialdehyde dehydrogenase